MLSNTKFWVLTSASLACIFIVLTATFPFAKHVRISFVPPREDTATCSFESFRAPKQNVWADLSSNEADDVVKFLFKKSGLNLTESSVATEFVYLHPFDKRY